LQTDLVYMPVKYCVISSSGTNERTTNERHNDLVTRPEKKNRSSPRLYIYSGEQSGNKFILCDSFGEAV